MTTSVFIAGFLAGILCSTALVVLLVLPEVADR